MRDTMPVANIMSDVVHSNEQLREKLNQMTQLVERLTEALRNERLKCKALEKEKATRERLATIDMPRFQTWYKRQER